MTRTVTLVSKYDGLMVIVEEGKKPRSRLWCQAAGLDVYLIGTASGVSHDRLTNLACNIALEMHVPLVSLHYADRKKK